MTSNTLTSSSAVRADALFVSALQGSEQPRTRQVRQAVTIEAARKASDLHRLACRQAMAPGSVVPLTCDLLLLDVVHRGVAARRTTTVASKVLDLNRRMVGVDDPAIKLLLAWSKAADDQGLPACAEVTNNRMCRVCA